MTDRLKRCVEAPGEGGERRKVMLREITKDQYWQLTGLLFVAQRQVARLGEIESSIRCLLEVRRPDEEISGEGDPSHIGDAIYSDYSADQLLEKLGITPPECES